MKKKIFYLLFLSVFASVLGMGIISPLMPLYAKNLGASGIWLGIVFSAYAVSRGIFTPLIGKLSDKKGRKMLIVSGLFLYSITSLLYISVSSIYSFTIIRLIHGLSSAMVIPIAMAYIGETTEKGKEGIAMGTFNTALFLGMAAGPFLGGMFDAMFGMSSAFYAMAGLTGAAFLVTLIFLPDLQPKKENKKKSIPLKTIIKNKAVKSLLVFRVIEAVARSGIMVFLPLFGAAKHISISELGIIISVNLFLTGLLQRPFGILADRIDKFSMILVGMSISAIMLTLIPFCSNFTSLLIVSALIGLASAISIPASTAIIVNIGKNGSMGASMGIFSSGMSAGMALSPILLGIVMDKIGIDSVFWFAGGITLFGIACFYSLSRAQYGVRSQLSTKKTPAHK